MSPYLHQTQNRIRVRSDFIQRNPELVKQAINELEKQTELKRSPTVFTRGR